MHRTTSRLLTVCAVALAVATCAFPTDNSPKVLVIIEAPHTFVLRGEEMTVHARAIRIVGTDTIDVPNVDFTWASGSGGTATVTADCCGYATITGVNSGLVDIIASAVNFNQATPGDLSLRVSNPLEIDSVRPRIIRFGGLLTVYGIGVDGIFLASLGNADLIEFGFPGYRPSVVRDTVTGEAQVAYWVPPPATTGNLFYLGAGVFGFADSVTGVLPFDIFEPNDTNPSKVDLDAPGPFPLFPAVLFVNPALAFEQTPRGVEAADWFDFTTADTTSDYTFFINYPSAGDTSGTRTFLLDSLYYAGDYFGRDSGDFAGSDFMRCKGFFFGPLEASRDSTIVALRGLPSHSMHVVTFFQQPQRYGLTVVKAYVTSDPRVKPDKYEENDFCHYADLGNRNLGLATGFSDTLTIDNPFDVDYLRVTVPALNTIHIRTNARPFPAETDTSDIDLYVLTVPNSGTGTVLNIVGADTAAGSFADVAVTAPASPATSAYYIAVVDFAGVPTRYSLCFLRALIPGACTPIPAPPAPAPSLAAARSRRTRLERHAHLAPFGMPRAPSQRRAGGLFDPWHRRSP